MSWSVAGPQLSKSSNNQDSWGNATGRMTIPKGRLLEVASSQSRERNRLSKTLSVTLSPWACNEAGSDFRQAQYPFRDQSANNNPKMYKDVFYMIKIQQTASISVIVLATLTMGMPARASDKTWQTIANVGAIGIPVAAASITYIEDDRNGFI